MKSRRFHLWIIFIFLTGTLVTVPSMPVRAGTLPVIHTNDSGVGSLRAAASAADNGDTSVSSGVNGSSHADGATDSFAGDIPLDTRFASLPNLAPFTPAGWDFPIVPSATTGTHSVNTLNTTQNTYIDWAVTNYGGATSTTFYTRLYYDNSQVAQWYTSGLSQASWTYISDWVLNLTPTTGVHTLKIVTDVTNVVTESNENDNTWEHSFTWIGPNHTVTFNANGGMGLMSPQRANVPTALKLNTFTRLGYSFSGWNTTPKGTGTAYADGATYSFAADITLYAQWTAQSNLVAYAPAGWDFPIVPSATTGTHTVSTLYTNQNTYIDWAVISNGAATPTTFFSCLYYDNSQVDCWFSAGLSQGSWAFGVDLLLNLTPTPGAHTLKTVIDIYNDVAESNESDNTWEHAFIWHGPDHTVTFNANGGTGSMSPQTANVPTALKLNTFTRTGYSFDHWETASSDTYPNGAIYSFTADITLYAKWTALPSHTVTFNANGGTGSMSNQVANVPTALKVNTFTRSGYNFANWNTAANGSGTDYADGATYSFAADITLYAQWTALTNFTSFLPLIVR